MNIVSLSNLDLFRVVDRYTHKACYGYHQECYATEWQRLSGCGPSAATNIIAYLSQTRITLLLGHRFTNKENCLPAMEEIWEYVTPTTEGIPTTKIFYEAVISYTLAKGLNVEYDYCDIPEDKANRPELDKIIKFINGSLLKNSPIAFLNLCNGQVKNFEPWHWVTIISLEYEEDETSVFVNILDEGQIKRIDLKLWYNTTTLGGGFVYFTW
ncbi:hypothetical protein [Clostridium sp.]|uniref:hypothetical protein n=1 Tax=Clostridium sp. TaxID=1506 RepID=UPI003D6CC979